MSLHGSKSARKRLRLLEEAQLNSLSHLIKVETNTQHKRNLIAERNPLLYALGEKLTPHDHYNINNPSNPVSQTYQQYIDHEYIGEVEAQLQGEYK
jgi:hypothetical protein